MQLFQYRNGGSKLATVLGGMAVGAAIGSVGGPIGMAALGTRGGVIGGLAIDGAMLKLEEIISRDEFKKEILASIRDARVEFKSRLLGTQ